MHNDTPLTLKQKKFQKDNFFFFFFLFGNGNAQSETNSAVDMSMIRQNKKSAASRQKCDISPKKKCLIASNKYARERNQMNR